MDTKPPINGLAVDTARDDKIGYVMGYVGGYTQLRPVGGGVEWDASLYVSVPRLQPQAIRSLGGTSTLPPAR